MSQFPARLFVVIPCAGTGSRAGGDGPKQYRPIVGKPMVAHTVEVFRALAGHLSGLMLVVSPGDAAVRAALPDFPRTAGETLLPHGGATRAATVLAGLRALQAIGARADDWALVHDAARCLVTPAQVEALIAACENDPVGGLLAHRLVDTLKSATAEGRVAATLERGDKWLAQTPQMFRIGVLVDALQRAGDAVTDEASAIEAIGLAPLLVPGSAQNFKLTYPEDFALAEAVLKGRNFP
jgi:2-C-methyl-D-erythritol 4-phosphate cytidylyltransferase